MDWTDIGRIADILGLIGFLVTLVGFWKTYRQARESRKAADQARMAAQQARDGIRRIDLISEATFALSAVSTVREYIRESRWHSLSVKVDDLRQYVVSIKALLPNDDNRSKTSFETYAAGLAMLRMRLETWHGKGSIGTPILAGGKDHKETVRLLDSLSDLLIEVRNSIGGKSDGEQATN